MLITMIDNSTWGLITEKRFFDATNVSPLKLKDGNKNYTK